MSVISTKSNKIANEKKKEINNNEEKEFYYQLTLYETKKIFFLNLEMKFD